MNRKYLCIIYSLLVLITKVNSQPQLIGMSRWGGVSGEGTIFTIHGDGSNYPVSYTHLRAHETVLDLVCRLLLEKTNHTLL
mgnify:CR=1 FL=1